MAIPNETFVRIWQTSDSVREVAERAGTTRGAASTRASVMRRNGVPLRYFNEARDREPVDWDGLADIARSVEVD